MAIKTCNNHRNLFDSLSQAKTNITVLSFPRPMVLLGEKRVLAKYAFLALLWACKQISKIEWDGCMTHNKCRNGTSHGHPVSYFLPIPANSSNLEQFFFFSSRLFGAIWGYSELYNAIWSHLEPFGVIWSHLESFGDIWCHLEPF